MGRRRWQTDVELLEAVRGGSTAAYGMLYQRHVIAARSLARQITQGEQEVEEVLVATFARVLDLIRSGGGPVSAFRTYLLTAIRRQVASEDVELAGADDVYVDPELAGLERSPLARAYLALPERWRMVLWHVEVEGARPAEIAPLLGLPPGEVSVLVGRAREGLRQAYLALHEESGPGEQCRPILPEIVRHVEGGLPPREAGMVDEHVAECIDCRSVLLELADLTQGLRLIVGQLIAGPAVEDYLAELARATDTVAAQPRGSRRWAVPMPLQAVTAGVLAASVALATFLVFSKPVAESDRTVSLGAARTPRAPQSPQSRAAASAVPENGQARAGETAGQDTSSATSEAAEPGDLLDHRIPLSRRSPRADWSKQAPPLVDREPVRQAAAPKRPALVAALDPVGSLVRAQSGIVALRLRNTGTAPSKRVSVALRLPPGVRPMTGPRSDGWACRTAGRFARCTRDGLAAGEMSVAFLRVRVSRDAPLGRKVRAVVRSGALELGAKSPAGVRPHGTAARFAVDGRVTSRVIGNKLVGPAAGVVTVSPREFSRSVTPSDLGSSVSPRDPGRLAVGEPSWARLDLPRGSRVLWAGLYWWTAGDNPAPPSEILVRPPGARRYRAVHPAEITRSELPVGPGYRAFAEVTELVRNGSLGRWWVAAPETAAGPGIPGVAPDRHSVSDLSDVGGQGEAVRQAGWNLVVVATDRRQPYRRMAILDSALADQGLLEVPLDGLMPSAVPVTIELVRGTALVGDTSGVPERGTRR